MGEILAGKDHLHHRIWTLARKMTSFRFPENVFEL